MLPCKTFQSLKTYTFLSPLLVLFNTLYWTKWHVLICSQQWQQIRSCCWRRKKGKYPLDLFQCQPQSCHPSPHVILLAFLLSPSQCLVRLTLITQKQIFSSENKVTHLFSSGMCDAHARISYSYIVFAWHYYMSPLSQDLNTVKSIMVL